MSMPVALVRVDEIQQRIQTLWARAAPSASPAPVSAPTATAFAAALEDALGATPMTGDTTGAGIVEQAKNYLGVPYVFGGEDESGMDCSGLVQRVLADLGIEAPRLVSGQAGLGEEVPSLAEAQPGDLLVTHGNTHIVIYAGDGKIIHAPRPGKDVRLVENYLTDADISTIRRVAPPAAQPPAAAAPSSAAPAPLAPTTATAAAASLLSVLTAAAPTSFGTSDGSTTTTRALDAAAQLAIGQAALSLAGDDGRATDAAPISLPAPSALTTSATPAPAVTVAPAAARAPLYTQVASPVLNLARASDGTHTLTLRVSPEDLGPVTVRAQITGGAIRVELVAPSDAGRDALRAILVDLRRDLAGLATHSSITVAAANDTSPAAGQSAAGSSTPWSAGAGSGSGQPGQPGQAGQPGHPDRPDHLPAPRTEGTPEQGGSAAPDPAGAVSGIDLYA